MIRIHYDRVDFTVCCISTLVLIFIKAIAVFFSSVSDPIIQFFIDTKSNIIGVIIASFFFNSFYENTSLKIRLEIATSVSVGFIIYEQMQLYLPWLTYDLKDIAGTLIGLCLALIINVLINRNQKSFQTDEKKSQNSFFPDDASRN